MFLRLPKCIAEIKKRDNGIFESTFLCISLSSVPFSVEQLDCLPCRSAACTTRSILP